MTRRPGWTGRLLRAWVRQSRTRSPWLVHFDCGGCNGCDIEVLDALTPRHSAERFGVVNVGNPRQADLLVVTGPANGRNAATLRTVFAQLAEPRAVVAVGSCAAHGGVFRGAPNVIDGVGRVVPVDVYVPGCPPPPQAILDGILAAAPLLADRRRSRRPAGGPGEPSLVTEPPAPDAGRTVRVSAAGLGVAEEPGPLAGRPTEARDARAG